MKTEKGCLKNLICIEEGVGTKVAAGVAVVGAVAGAHLIMKRKMKDIDIKITEMRKKISEEQDKDKKYDLQNKLDDLLNKKRDYQDRMRVK